MIRNASETLKIGEHSTFDPNFDVGIGTFYPEKFRQAYCTSSTQFCDLYCVFEFMCKKGHTRHINDKKYVKILSMSKTVSDARNL